MRCGEFTLNKSVQFDPAVHVSGSSIDFVNDVHGKREGLRLSLAASKTDPFRKGVVMFLAAAPGLTSDPVAALERLLESRSTHDVLAPLFQEAPGAALTRNTFIREVRDALERAGIPPAGYAGHSFRRGAATMAAANGIHGHEIQLLGRWRSDAWKLYVNVDPRRVKQLSRSLHGAQTLGATYDPLGSA